MEKSECGSLSHVGADREPYPKSTIHEIQTEDKVRISCRHWKCVRSAGRQLKADEKPYPVLLLNGYSIESYCLPTEPNDLVRTLLKDGHDIWLLHGRVMHCQNSLKHFTVDDIGTMDIPAVINKMIEFHGASTKVHVVGHCIGGVGIHMALMGGYVSAKHIASLSCTNSSMFFKHTTIQILKAWLPIVPMTMALMGENTILPMHQGSTASYRHRLVKTLARLMPRQQRCSYDECVVYAGIFSNPFWHENISESVHHWLCKEIHKMLPMAGLHHMGIIARRGYIVDSKGRNVYLIHPERMAVPTLYVSGGRHLIITPETSLRANEYMKLHQPGYRHQRVVVDGFGHYDLLIGKESYNKVFPHIQQHIKLAEEERSSIKENDPY